jgi:hypothetical protein
MAGAQAVHPGPGRGLADVAGGTGPDEKDRVGAHATGRGLTGRPQTFACARGQPRRSGRQACRTNASSLGKPQTRHAARACRERGGHCAARSMPRSPLRTGRGPAARSGSRSHEAPSTAFLPGWASTTPHAPWRPQMARRGEWPDRRARRRLKEGLARRAPGLAAGETKPLGAPRPQRAAAREAGPPSSPLRRAGLAPRLHEKVCATTAAARRNARAKAAHRHAADHATSPAPTLRPARDTAGASVLPASRDARRMTGVDLPVGDGWAVLRASFTERTPNP